MPFASGAIAVFPPVRFRHLVELSNLIIIKLNLIRLVFMPVKTQRSFTKPEIMLSQTLRETRFRLCADQGQPSRLVLFAQVLSDALEYVPRLQWQDVCGFGSPSMSSGTSTSQMRRYCRVDARRSYLSLSGKALDTAWKKSSSRK